MKEFDFSVFRNVTITGTDMNSLSTEESSVLYRQAEYCQAMTESDIGKLREIVSEDITFTHMNGLKQTREEYFADIDDGNLDYHTIGIENPAIEVNGKRASISFTSVLNANAYGASGTFRFTFPIILTMNLSRRQGSYYFFAINIPYSFGTVRTPSFI